MFPNPQADNRVDDVVAPATRAYDLGVRQVIEPSSDQLTSG